MPKRVLPLLAALAALAIAGCGGSSSNKVDVRQIRSVVMQFALANGPKACNLMSPDGLVNVYGAYVQPVARAKKNCVRKSKQFQARPVTLTVLNVIDSATVKQGALSPDRKITYSVTLRKFGPSWRIDSITQRKTQ